MGSRYGYLFGHILRTYLHANLADRKSISTHIVMIVRLLRVGEAGAIVSVDHGENRKSGGIQKDIWKDANTM